MFSHRAWLLSRSPGAIALFALLSAGLPGDGGAIFEPVATPDTVGMRSADGFISVGRAAPAFTLPDGTGREFRLADFRGRPLVLYFYPMDDTPGCTKEACSFRDDSKAFDSLGVRVVGVSADDPASHRAFAAKYRLGFTLLSDTTGAVLRLYGAGVEIDQRDVKRVIAKRITYLIDKDGIVRHVWPKVNPVGHSAEILASWQGLVSGKG